MNASTRAVELASAAAAAAQDKLAHDVVALDVTGQLALTDVFVIASAPNERQVSAIVDAVLERLLELNSKVLRREGVREARWVLLDFGDIIVHVMHEEDRAFYELERLWKDCPSLAIEAASSPPPPSS